MIVIHHHWMTRITINRFMGQIIGNPKNISCWKPWFPEIPTELVTFSSDCLQLVLAYRWLEKGYKRWLSQTVPNGQFGFFKCGIPVTSLLFQDVSMLVVSHPKYGKSRPKPAASEIPGSPCCGFQHRRELFISGNFFKGAANFWTDPVWWFGNVPSQPFVSGAFRLAKGSTEVPDWTAASDWPNSSAPPDIWQLKVKFIGITLSCLENHQKIGIKL